MATPTRKRSLSAYQQLVKELYGPANERHYDVEGMLINVQRFSTRALKGIRKGEEEKIQLNLAITTSWFLSLLNQLGIDLEKAVWHRFPYECSYCVSCPCICKDKKINKRKRFKALHPRKPVTLEDLQKMFDQIYPMEKRTPEHAGIHLAEEVGEFAEAVFRFRGKHGKEELRNIELEAADVFSCVMGVCNSLEFNFSKEVFGMFARGCHVCHKKPCECSYTSVMGFKS